tara:strand:- start:561 stop:1556 length:996 start_codon:yes stop_codon:yes gene_type:complete
MATLAEIRAKLQAQDTRSSGGKSGGDNAIYPHWNISEGTTATLRFLPDSNSSNTFFWAERAMIRLPFQGIKGQVDSKPITVQVPCMEMWEPVGSCPILAEVRPWFKDSSLEDMGRKYWKKKSYVFQGFVRENPLDEESPENPVRRFIMGPQLFNIIKASLMDPDMEELPTDYNKGIDFRVVKTSKGGYADYSTSNWARKESALTEVENNAISTYGLYDLNDFLPKKPNEAEVGIIKQMFEDSVDGKAYDSEKYSQYFRPSGVQLPDSGNAKTVTPEKVTAETSQTTATETAPVEPAKTTDAVADAPVETPKSGDSGQRAEDILAMIRSRQK